MTERRGFALAAALLALMLIATLAASVFFAATEETRIGRATGAKQLALLAAESAIETTIAGWSSAVPDSIGVGDVRASTIDGFGTPVRVHVTRLDSSLYWIVAAAGPVSSQSSPATRIGALVTVQIAPDHSITIDRSAERWWSELF